MTQGERESVVRQERRACGIRTTLHALTLDAPRNAGKKPKCFCTGP